jgi:hypothetical protein
MNKLAPYYCDYRCKIRRRLHNSFFYCHLLMTKVLIFSGLSMTMSHSVTSYPDTSPALHYSKQIWCPPLTFFLSRLSSDDQTFCVTLLSMPMQADLTINNLFLLPPAGNGRYTNKHCPPTPLPFLLSPPPSPSFPVPSNHFLRATHYQNR